MQQKQAKDNIPWLWQGRPVQDSDIPEGCIGMVYRITTYLTKGTIERDGRHGLKTCDSHKKIYIGKKQLTQTNKRKIGVRAQAKQLAETGDKRRIKKVQRITKESTWRTYNSSCKPLQLFIEEYPELVTKEIIAWCHSKKQLSYMETKHQILENVIEVDSWNDHIGHWYRRDIVKINKDEVVI